MTIKPERCAIVDFSNPDSRFMATIAVKSGNPLHLQSYQDIAESSEARLGGVAATYELQLARLAGVPDSRIVQFPNDDAMISGLVGGRVDAVTSVGPMLVAMLDKKSDPSIEMVQDFQIPIDANGNPAVSYGGFVFRKGESDLIDMFNGGIADAITSGWRLENLKQYGLGESSLPGQARAAEICAG
jgi:polar amino acid transport system substrate-binding protein